MKKYKEKDFLKVQSYKEILELEPEHFEWFCKFLLPYLGYKSLFVKGSTDAYHSDGGVDITGKFAGDDVLIQCKRLTGGNHGYTPIHIIRELRGCMNDEYKRGAVVSTLPFGKLAHEEAARYHVELIGRDEIVETMQRINSSFKS